MPKSSKQESVAPPAAYQGTPGRLGWINSPLVAAVVVMVRVAVCAVVPVIVTAVGAKLHAAGSFAATGVMVQPRLTVPIYPFDGVTVMIEVFPVVAPRATETDAGVPLTVKLGLTTGFTVRTTEAV
jgi:hypothetical protein